MAVQLGGLGRFETTFKSLQIQFAEFDERVKRLAALTPEQKQPLADGLAELAEARLAYDADRAALLGELTDFRDRHAAALPDANEAQRDRLLAKAKWLDETIIEIVMSEAQNEVADFGKWGFDIIPHRAIMKRGFETADGQRVDVESAFKDPAHPFRIAIVCAMWLTGFDVECLSTLYLDKPMKAHTLMQAIARANRRYPGKDFGLIVDYNGILKSLREALAQ